MPAYVVFVRDTVIDPAQMDQYLATAPAAGADHAIEALAAYGAFEVLEGPPADGVVLLRFPDMAAARTWYDSPAYQKAAAHRHAGAAFRVVLFEGLPDADAALIASPITN